MKLTDAEIDEIVTQPCSATGRRKKELAIEVKELRAANTHQREEIAQLRETIALMVKRRH
jgi:hypothetical protein